MPHGHLHLDLKDPEVRAWAESILKEQDKEIGVMRALLARMGGLDQAAYQAMTRGMAAMVARLKGAGDRERAFVELMLEHHKGAEEIHRFRLWLLK
jgi:Uncharacterized protein conserved in bacteria, COG3544